MHYVSKTSGFLPGKNFRSIKIPPKFFYSLYFIV